MAAGNPIANGHLEEPTWPPYSDGQRRMLIEFQDGCKYSGWSFGSEKSVAGELVFQTGMVGYNESLTDPSYRGQILVMTWPLIGNYGVPSRKEMDSLLKDVPAHFESAEIHIAGLIVASYAGEDYSHHLAVSSLGAWLKEQGVPAVYGVDTRAITKKIRQQGSMLGRLLIESQSVNGVATTPGALATSNMLDGDSWRTHFDQIDWVDPNTRNLVAEVSCKEPHLYAPAKEKALFHPSGRPVRVVCVDVGLKYNQLRCLVSRGVEVLRVPWDYDFPELAGKDYDGLFISNGPGDPALLGPTVKRIKAAIDEDRTPIFGICLGHQVLCLAAGARTLKMKFGNRGLNIPCTNTRSGRCYITSQNHGFAVDATSLPEQWEELFVNANDGSNEGIVHKSRPIFSVQFHPESSPGPRDTEFLFDVFINSIQSSIRSVEALLQPIEFPGGSVDENKKLHPRVNVQKALILGSGGLAIAQGGEFDERSLTSLNSTYANASIVLWESSDQGFEGGGIATIQTSKGLADKVYFLPVNADFVRKVIKHERPDAILVTFGGQTALQVGIELKDEFSDLGVKVLGTPIETIITTEDRELFARSMESIGERCAKSATASSVEEALNAAQIIGYPVIVRAAYALGGLGSGFAENEEELLALCQKAFASSPQVLVERSMKGWKEIEFEVVRDAQDNCIAVIGMENFDPLGIHTGDSIVIAPCQTLSDNDFQMLRSTALSVIRHLRVVGECNIQYALNPDSKEYCIIEVNARLSRSSALASKASGYSLAFVAAKLGLGISLTELSNGLTKATTACFEPSLDYVVLKVPRWDLTKFTRVSTALTSSMKSVGEAMSIGRTFEEAIQNAIRAIDFQNLGFNATSALMSIDNELQTPSDQRLFAIANAMHAGYSVQKIWEMTKIDRFFLLRLQSLSDFGKYLSKFKTNRDSLGILRRSKELGFCDRQLAKFWNSNEVAVRNLRVEAGIIPFMKQIDTVAAEFPAATNYLYMTYNAAEHDVDFSAHGVMVLGSGPYRIGSSNEYDWGSVHAIRTLREQGYKTVMLNCNPSTVSTDWDEADNLYFTNITLENVLDIYDLEKPQGVIVSMGGQTPNNIALALDRANVKILGTSPSQIDVAENRYKFSRMLDEIQVDQPAWKELKSFEDAANFCETVGYPVLVRASYILSGAAMNVVYSHHDLENYLVKAAEVSPAHPVVVTKYIEGAKEIEMDAVARNGKMVGHFISEHVENAGVHSGDASLILPPQDLDPETVRRCEEATRKIGDSLNVTGCFNIQFIARENEIKVIECNLRASRSFPFVSKVMGVDLIEMAIKAMMGLPVEAYPEPKIPRNYVAAKVPQFSFSRLGGADPVLGVEMASTGEVACFGRNRYEAYLKGLISTGFKLPRRNILLSIGGFKDKMELLPSVKKLHELGYHLFATAGTADFLEEHGVPVKYLEVLTTESDKQKAEYSLLQHLENNLIDLYINLPSKNRFRRPANYTSAGYTTRRRAIDFQIPLVTNVKNAKMLIEALARKFDLEVIEIDYKTTYETTQLPGLVNMSSFIPGVAAHNNHDFEIVSKASVAAGFSMISVTPLGIDTSITDALSLRAAQQNSRYGAYCDYRFSVAATSSNADQVGQVANQVGSLYIPKNVNKVETMVEAWPSQKLIITDAKTTNLAFILLLASLHNRKLHVTSVTTSDDIEIIASCKAKGMNVTCDVSVYSLFFSQDDFPQCTFLPTARDQDVIWQHMKTIDAFSVGALPYQVAIAAKENATPAVGIADTLPLLFTAVKDGKLTVNDIEDKLCHSPRLILDLRDQDQTTIEVEINRPYIVQPSATWSPLVGRTMYGSVNKVLFRGEMACLDGKLTSEAPIGRDASANQLPFTKTEGKPVVPLQARARADSILAPLFVKPQLADIHTSTPVLQTQPSFNDIVPSFSQTSYRYEHLREQIRKSLFHGRHVLSVDHFTHDHLHQLFAVAQEMKIWVERDGVIDLLRGRIVCTLFYEPSTRTSASFDAAVARLGGRTIPIVASYSSSVKGESLTDTIRTLGCYGDAVVLRHPDPASATMAAKASQVPIINGGNGSVEHPTQAFLDLFTIRSELGTIHGKVITFIGDLKYGRTVHSLIKLLLHYHVSIQLVAPESLSLPLEIRRAVTKCQNVKLEAESDSLDADIVRHSDVLYCTRVQKERFQDPSEYERLQGKLIVDNSVLVNAKKEAIVMHPLPRNDEIDPEVDTDQRAAYFRQMRLGLYCRMALLALVIGPKN